MCTVSFISSQDSIIITSNRDEHVSRPKAIAPQNYSINNITITYPKDPKGSGTWFAYNEFGTVVVLLNGADEKHTPKEAYKKSRGLIVLDIIASKQPLIIWKNSNLDAIEPFTLVLFYENKLYQLRWNEIEKSDALLDATQHHIWSSATLYTSEIRNQRQQWFENFIKTTQQILPKDAIHFHTKTQSDNLENGLLIQRENGVQTKNITQLVISKKQLSMSHFDVTEYNQSSKISVTI